MIGIALVTAKVDLPDGIYSGTWSAYTIVIAGHPGVHLETVEGMRSIGGVAVTIKVTAGRPTAEENAS